MDLQFIERDMPPHEEIVRRLCTPISSQVPAVAGKQCILAMEVTSHGRQYTGSNSSRKRCVQPLDGPE